MRRGFACVAYEGDNGYAALIADVAVNKVTEMVKPIRFTIAMDCGPISNQDGRDAKAIETHMHTPLVLWDGILVKDVTRYRWPKRPS
jgi:hypothetical protein